MEYVILFIGMGFIITALIFSKQEENITEYDKDMLVKDIADYETLMILGIKEEYCHSVVDNMPKHTIILNNGEKWIQNNNNSLFKRYETASANEGKLL